ncbi:hypothetical protein G4V62_13960 [Bacillaceae bacterium SIJ1]|uniref:hypothetical protein n=1 Tax=Litoribacterium kuwaitense TaxID=1398745 RepID=UPI0013EC05F6|nr:hypothetical protein [Litoribacterium kuwaitense]NGP45999.1 hypothetical protein [Litoribacterium kuwaitense]
MSDEKETLYKKAILSLVDIASEHKQMKEDIERLLQEKVEHMARIERLQNRVDAIEKAWLECEANGGDVYEFYDDIQYIFSVGG